MSDGSRRGLAGKKNGELLSIAEHQGYTIFLTMDKGVEYEQNLKRRSVAIMILRAKSNRLVDLLPLVRDCVNGKWIRSERARLFELADEVAFLYAFCMQ